MHTHTLNDGTRLPAVGFGTGSLEGDDGVAAITSAIEVGYRLVDTAVNYHHEEEVGEAIRRSGVDRDELVVTSKLPGRHHAYADAVASTKDSRQRLGLDHLDLHLIHWPNPGVGQYVEAWRALVDLRQQGLVRSIGVSNFTEDHLTRVIDETGVTPAVNQPSCTRASRSRTCGRCTSASASVPSRGARSANSTPPFVRFR